jgi:hypothetical protein
MLRPSCVIIKKLFNIQHAQVSEVQKYNHVKMVNTLLYTVMYTDALL